ncbi:unnamed protein product [Ambrosiozyma monospora]|uniref:Unnamed protein product n=1 Tax=Ambrosiozyma monospora TaxID=43982 RepID=A0A9W6YUG7_AMBMO|nr:unnamed protein product [Ambrosiozyma monospora]
MRLFGKIISTLLFLGAILCLLLTVLIGATSGSAMKNFYWLQTNTSKYPGAQFQTTRWTNYGMCDVKNNHNTNCGHSAAYAFSPKDNFSSKDQLPSAFIKHRKTYYYLTRIAYGFLIGGLAFLVFAMLPFFLFVLFGKMGSIAIPMYLLGTLFATAAIAMYTAAFILGKHKFNNDGAHSKLGVKAFGTSWAGIACLIFGLPSLFRRSKNRGSRGGRGGDDEFVYADNDNTESEAKKNGWFVPHARKNKRRRSRRNNSTYDGDVQLSPMQQYGGGNPQGQPHDDATGGVRFMSLVQQRDGNDTRRHNFDSDSSDDDVVTSSVGKDSYPSYSPHNEKKNRGGFFSKFGRGGDNNNNNNNNNNINANDARQPANIDGATGAPGAGHAGAPGYQQSPAVIPESNEPTYTQTAGPGAGAGGVHEEAPVGYNDSSLAHHSAVGHP